MTSPARYARELTGQRHGPHDDTTTAGTAALTAETIRYLNYAATHGGLTSPATICTLTGELSAAASRLPQLLTRLAGWLDTQASTGAIADDHHRPAPDITGQARAALELAARHAASLAAALAAAQNLTATLHPAAPAEGKPDASGGASGSRMDGDDQRPQAVSGGGNAGSSSRHQPGQAQQTGTGASTQPVDTPAPARYPAGG
jgi:hypothetical protein